MYIQSQPGALSNTARVAGTPNNPAGLLFGEGGFSEIMGRYANLAINQRIMSAFSLITSGVVYSTAAGTGGPLLWNGTTSTAAHLLAVLIGGVTTANTVPTTVGITGNTGQTAAPSSTTAITASGNTYIGGPSPTMNVYNVGTVTNPGNRFIPLAAYGTGAVTVVAAGGGSGWIDLGGTVIVPPNAWAAVSFAATATTGVINLGLLWAELPA